ncbi:MAG TPA: pectinesterase family protein, partial [Chthoniobacterales bacterium]
MIRVLLGTALCWLLSASALTAETAPIVVAPDGSGQFKTVQAAIDSFPDNNAEWKLVLLKPGTYRERVVINERKTFLILRGEDKEAGRTLLTFNRYAGMNDPEAPGKKLGPNGSETVVIQADNFITENITFENSSGAVAPAVAVRAMGDKQIFRNCRFLGWQDTLWVDGKRAYFTDCYVEGRIDFIFGRATAVFERGRIHALDGGCITASSTDPETPFGLVFLKSKVTCAEDKTYLGSPWNKGAAAAFIECDLGENLRPEGWVEWRGADHHKTARFVEYRNTGPGA